LPVISILGIVIIRLPKPSCWKLEYNGTIQEDRSVYILFYY